MQMPRRAMQKKKKGSPRPRVAVGRPCTGEDRRTFGSRSTIPRRSRERGHRRRGDPDPPTNVRTFARGRIARKRDRDSGEGTSVCRSIARDIRARIAVDRGVARPSESFPQIKTRSQMQNINKISAEERQTTIV